MQTPDLLDYRTLSPEELVNLLADKRCRNEVIRALVGGLTATELRRVQLSEAAFQALVAGLEHANPKVRWWCLQLFDHVGDERCVPAVLPRLEDPIPRVRKHALHMLECQRCKQSPAVVEAIRAALEQQKTNAAERPRDETAR